MKFQNEEIEKVVEHIRKALEENKKLIEDEMTQSVKDTTVANGLLPSGKDAKIPFAKLDINLELTPLKNDGMFIDGSVKISHPNAKNIPLGGLTIDNQPDMFDKKTE